VWSDNETIIDLIGFQIHATLIRKVAVDPLASRCSWCLWRWGGGKSSIMRMLEDDLQVSSMPMLSACISMDGCLRVTRMQKVRS